MAIPGIVEGSLVDTPQAGIQINPQAFRKPLLEKGRAYAQAGQAVSGLFQDTTDKILQNRMAGQVFKADLNMRKRYDDFTASLVNMPDSGTWLPAWNEEADAEKERTLDDPHLSPEAKRIIGQKFDAWKEATTSSVNIAALKKGVNETRQIYHHDSNYAASSGHIDGHGGANDLADAAFANHAINAKERDQDKKRFAIVGAESAANQTLTRFPIDAPDILPTLKNWDKIDSHNQKVLLHQAKEARAGAQSSNLDQWSEKLDNSPTHDLDVKGLKRDLDQRQISQKGYDSILTRQKKLVAEDQKQAALEDRNEASLIGLDLTNANFVGVKDPKAQDADFTDRINGIADPALRERLTKQLQQKRQSAEKEGAHEEKPVIKDQLDYMKQDFDEGAAFVPMTQGKPAVSRWFRPDIPAEPPQIVLGGIKAIDKMSDGDFTEAFGKGVKRSDVIEAARLNYAKKQQQFLAWARDPKNAEATVEQAMEERRRLEAPDIDNLVGASLQNATPTPTKNQAEIDKAVQAALGGQ